MPNQIKKISRTDACSPLPIWQPSVTLSSYNQFFFFHLAMGQMMIFINICLENNIINYIFLDEIPPNISNKILLFIDGRRLIIKMSCDAMRMILR